MNLRAFSFVLIVSFVLLAAFAALNWSVLAAPATLSLGFASISASPGMVLLVFTLVISGLFVLYILILQASVILEARRLTKEVRTQRELADTAEASRFTELRSLLEVSERGTQVKLVEATDTLSAYLGEIEDKLDQVLRSPKPPGS